MSASTPEPTATRPTHQLFLVEEFVNVSADVKQGLLAALVESLNNRPFSINVGGDPKDQISVTWKLFDLSQNWFVATSRFDGMYLRHLVDAQIREVEGSLVQRFGLAPGQYRLRHFLMENLGGVMDASSTSLEEDNGRNQWNFVSDRLQMSA